MSRSFYGLLAAGFGIAILAAAGGYWLAHQETPVTERAAEQQRQVLYWYDPMYPAQQFDKPGKSPFMDMDLVPKYADEAGTAAAGVRIDSRITQNLGMRLATVQYGSLARPLTAVANLTFDERRIAVVQARTRGFVERVYARAPGDVLRRGDALVDLLVPEWAGAQAEYLALLDSDDAALIRAARQRLRLLGMEDELIDDVEASRRARPIITMRTPFGGVIDTLEVRTGMTVEAGATLATINGLETVWAEAFIPEAQGALLSLQKRVEVRVTAYPQQRFRGEVISVLPQTNADTRTLRVRIALENPERKLKPGMFAEVQLDTGDLAPALYVPTEAVIRSGIRNLVLVTDGAQQFTPTEVQLGAEVDGNTIIESGLQAGQQVVASGQFLIDSEANLSGVLARLENNSSDPGVAGDASYEATAKIASLEGERIVLDHDAVPALDWPAKSTSFTLERAELATGFEIGDRVKVRFRVHDQNYVIDWLGAAP